MKIITRKEGIFVKKEEGTKVIYHIFSEFELHYNEVPAGTKQLWHHHEVIEEVLYILSGKLEVHWREGSEEFSEQVEVGDVIRVENTPHTFTNPSKNVCTFVVFRFVPNGVNKQEMIKNDKYLD
jgi:uncharacterized RmlC-like cupin family protein